MEEATHTSRAALRPGTAGKNISQPGLRSCEPSGLRSNACVCEFQSADHSVNACVVSSRCFGSAAGFSVFQMLVQKGTATTAVPTSHPDSVAESFLDIGDVVVRRQDTSRARVQVVKPLVGDMSVAQVLNPSHLLPSTLGVERVLQTPETRPITES